MRFERAPLRSNVFGRWHHVTNEGQHLKRSYNIELFSDSDWATSKVSRKSTSAGLIFLNGHCIHSHSRAQASIALSSMEAEVLAATGLLAEGVCIKQALQFLLNCKQDLGCNEEIEMKLYMDSTSAQAFFQRLGPGRAKHLSTRILWGQSAMRKQWFKVARISAQNNPADLNTKSLSRERREFLEQLIGLHSNTFKEQTMPSVRRVIHLLAAAGFLKGCGEDAGSCMSERGFDEIVRHQAFSLAILTGLIVMLVVMLSVFIYHINHMRVQLFKYKDALEDLQNELTRQQMRRRPRRSTSSETGGGNDDDGEDPGGDDPFSGYVEHTRTNHPYHGDEGDEWYADDENSGYENVHEPQQNSAGSSGAMDEAALWGKRGSDMVEGDLGDEDSSPRAWRALLQYYGQVQMECEEGDEQFEDVEEEEESENAIIPASSSAGHEHVTRRRLNNEEEAHESISDMVADDLIQQGRALSRQDQGDLLDVDYWCVPGSRELMLSFGCTGIPAIFEEFQQWRQELRMTTGGPEAEVIQVSRSLREHMRLLEIESQTFPPAIPQLSQCRRTWSYLYHLVKMFQEDDPRSYMAASIVFHKWCEAGRTHEFFEENATEAGTEANLAVNSECENEGEEEENAADEVAERLEESEDPDAWIQQNLMEDSEFDGPWDPPPGSTALRVVEPKRRPRVDNDEGNDG